MNKSAGIEKDIAVVGMSSLFAKTKNLDEYWKNIMEEIDCITTVPEDRWKVSDYYSADPNDADKTYSKVGGFIPDINFNPMEFGLPPNIIELTDSAQLLSLVAAKAALEDAGYWQNEKFNKELRQRTGVVLGVGGGQKLLGSLVSRLQYPIWERTLSAYGIPEKDLAIVIEHMKSAFVKWEENSFPGLLGNVIAGRITNRFDLGGTNCVVDAACATSLSAIKMAVMELQGGHMDMVITGGVDTDNSPAMYLSFSKTPAFSQQNKTRPFEDASDGIVIGEGIGLVVLKRLSDAVRDGNKIYSVIKGIGSSSDGKNKSIYAPQSSGQSLALQRTYEQAGYSMNTVGLIECHGTGTPTGDPVEFGSLKMEMANQPAEKQSIALSSVKSQIGHTKSAAGAAGFIKASLALYNKILPGTINVTSPNRKFEIENTPFYINTITRPWIKTQTPRRASVSAFGFGGTNFHIALEEYQPEHTTPYRSYTSSYAVILTAGSKNELTEKAGLLLQQLQAPNASELLAGIADNALKVTLKGDQPKLGFVAADVPEAIAKLTAAIQYISTTTTPAFEHPKGFYYSESDLVKGGKTAALFCGQGAQYVNMANEMTCCFPPFREVLAKLDEVFINSGEKALSKVVYPVPAFTEERKAQQKQELTQTQYAQPAIGAISMAYYKLLTQSGFSPHMVAGHSFGELTALWASGAVSEKDYLSLATARGRCMGAGTGAERGAMLAVNATPERIKEVVTNLKTLVVANINAGNQVVLGGEYKEIEMALAQFQGLGISAVILPVSAAFHTSFVEHAAGPFAEVIANTQFELPAIPVYSNTSAAAYPNTIEAIKTTLAAHILKPVLFKDEIEQMYNDNARIFVEFGPKGILTSLVKKILNGKEFIAIAINPSEEKGSEYQFKEAVVKMKIAGLPVGEPDVYKIPAQKNITADKLNIVLSGANHQSAETVKCYNEGFEKIKQLMRVAETTYRRPAPDDDISQAQLPEIQQLPEPPMAPAATDLVNALLQIVSDKTGYPTDMLELSMDMEADLGIDSIKRMEIFGAMRAGFPTITGANPNEIATLKTLEQIVDYLEAKQGAGPAVIPAATSTTVVAAAPSKEINLTDNSIKRFEPRLKFLPHPDKLVIAWSKSDTVIVIDNGSNLPAAMVDDLLELKVNVVLVHLPGSVVIEPEIKSITHVMVNSVSDEAIKQIFDEIALKYNTVTGVICTSANTNEAAYLKAAFFMAKHFKHALNKQKQIASRPFFISVSTIDGYLGLNNSNNPLLLQGGFSGLVKTLGLEWPDVFCRSIDIQPGMDTQAAASLIIDELHDPNMELKEVALTESTRNTIVAEERAADAGSMNQLPVTSNDVFLVTGGGRGITSTCIKKLAQACKPKFILIGRSAIDSPEPDWATGVTDENELKKKMAAQLQQEGKKPVPAEVQKTCREIIACREIEQTLTDLKASGAEAMYFRADVRDKSLLEYIVKEASLKMGEITGIIHGAGVLADKLIEQKLEHDFDQVFSIKVGGLLSVLDVLPPQNLKYLLLFSSVAGFYGNPGQADYALSNEILNKMALHIAARYPQCKTVAYNWGPWDAGMVSPELKKMFEERNVLTIPPHYGAQIFVSELRRVYSGNTQVIVGSALTLPAVKWKPGLKKYTIERKLKLAGNPFLYDHVISGNAVLPAVTAISMIADSCRQFYPGLKVAAIEDMRVLKGIIFHQKFNENFVLELTELKKDQEEVLFEGALYSEPVTGKRTMHYKARVLLAPHTKQSPVVPVEALHNKAGIIEGDTLYEDGTLFHGPSFRGITQVLKINNNELIVKCFIKPVSEPVQGQFPVSDINAFIMDVKLQGLLVWAKHLFGAASLPVKLTKGEFFKPMRFNTEYFVIFKIRDANDVIMSADIHSCDKDGNVCVEVTGAEIVLSSALNEVFANKKNALAL